MRNSFPFVRIFLYGTAILASLGILIISLYGLSRSTSFLVNATQSLKTKTALATYQFNPSSGTLVVGSETQITSATAAATEGVNVGSWKGTLADDNFHWVVQGAGSAGLDVNLTVGGVALNGTNKLIIQTEIDIDPVVLATLVQICDFVSAVQVDDPADPECPGGWRTLNTRNNTQTPVALTGATAVALQWHIYDGYWSTGTQGGTPLATPLSNFVSPDHNIKIRYYSTTNSTSQLAIDYLRAYAVVDPIYLPAGFEQVSGDTPIGHYGNAFAVGNTTVTQQVVTTGDATYLQVPGTATDPADFYIKFRNIKTYEGMNTILVNTDAACSGSVLDLQYRFKIMNFKGTTDTSDDVWEDISSPLDCITTNYFNTYAKNNIAIADYINQAGEIWVGMYATSPSTVKLWLDSMYIMLGTTNTDKNSCEISFGGNTAGRIASNPSAPGSDRIQAMMLEGSSLYIAGYDSSGSDNEWRLEKRSADTGDLDSSFGTGGIVVSDPSLGHDQIFAMATSTDAIFLGGYDSAVSGTNGQWRIEKRDKLRGDLDSSFGTGGVIQFNPNTDIDQVTAMAYDESGLYVVGFEDDDTGVWRVHKYDATTGELKNDFGTGGMITETLSATGDERPQAVRVDAQHLYIAGYDNIPGNNEWRIEKRDKITGALVSGFGTGGVIQSNMSANIDRAYALVLDDDSLYIGGHDGVLSAINGEWRLEKRSKSTGALVTSFASGGVALTDPTSADIDWITDLALDQGYIYSAGFKDDDAGSWYLEKRDRTTGTLVTQFSGDGAAQSEDGGDDRANVLALSSTHLFVGGYGSAPGDNQWLLEKRDIITGMRTSDSFGENDCAGTRDIDTTGGNRNAWAIQTEDESTDFSHTYFALDNDGDAIVEEAGSANIGFSVKVPQGTSVAGVHFAGRAMSGVAGTVRLALKDYSGLTGTTGGRSLLGGNLTLSLAYTDSLTVGGPASGGMAGFMTNPEDHIDTINNEMRLNLNTLASGAANINSVNVWDFAMVSFSWVEVEARPSYSIAITTDGEIEYGTLPLGTSASSTSDTQLVLNDGPIATRISVRSSDASGTLSSWMLSPSIGSDAYTHEFSTTTDTWVSLPDSATYVEALSSLPVMSTLPIDFRITLPSATIDFDEKNIMITVQASAP